MDEANLQALKAVDQGERSKLSTNYDLSSYNYQSYYYGTDDLDGNSLMLALREIISTDITEVSYGEARFILELSDFKESPYGTYLYGIYDSKKLVRYWDRGATWDREHVWPKSYLNGGEPSNTTRNITSDVHNLRAIFGSTNRSRGNKYFADSIDGTTTNHGVITGGYYPGNDHRGDAARIILYMAVRYSQLSLTDIASEITANDTYNANATVFGLLSTLLLWHELDPVDEFEIQRNNVIYEYQGNRNPFIDNPEFVSMIWGLETEDGYFEVELMFVNVDINFSDLDNKYDDLFS